MKKEFLNVVKASVKLEGVFGPRPIMKKEVLGARLGSGQKEGSTLGDGAVSNQPSLATRESVVSVESTASVGSGKEGVGVIEGSST